MAPGARARRTISRLGCSYARLASRCRTRTTKALRPRSSPLSAARLRSMFDQTCSHNGQTLACLSQSADGLGTGTAQIRSSHLPNGIVAPAGTPREALTRLHAEIAKAVQMPGSRRLSQQPKSIRARARPSRRNISGSRIGRKSSSPVTPAAISRSVTAAITRRGRR